MKKFISVLMTQCFIFPIFSQQVINLEENIPYSYNGLEYGFYVTNEVSKEVKGEDYFRYEINLYVTNKSGCLKLIPFRPTNSGSNNNNDEVMLAEFNCTNATGKRLTAKKGTVNAKPWFTNVKMPDETVKEKYRMMSVQAGYAIRNGQTLAPRIIVIVPKGERPKMNSRISYLPEIQ